MGMDICRGCEVGEAEQEAEESRRDVEVPGALSTWFQHIKTFVCFRTYTHFRTSPPQLIR